MKLTKTITVIRTRWVATGLPETKTFEVDADNLDAIVSWLNPGRQGYVELHFDDEHHTILAVDGKHDPLRTFGFGPFGHITRADGTRVLVKQPNPALPLVAVGYAQVHLFTPEEAATFALVTLNTEDNALFY